ncbi:MAG: TonB-dependent receptor [Betaproteobacteria bacterium]|nr:TonB-dependent receptor [Betaproteobacteria bacterium]
MYKCFTLAACAASCLSPGVSLAADQLAVVVVTATRQATRTNELIADLTVIEREAIEQAGPTTLPELLSRQPGLHVVDNGGVGKATSVFMRGTSSTHTLLLVDGMPLGSVTTGSPSLHNLPLSQIERIEILRGPASSLYGSDAIGGVIQIFTRRGEGPMRMNAYAGIGGYGTREVQAGVSGSQGPWSYSFAASRFSTDGFNVAADPVRFRTSTFSVPNSDSDGYRNTSHAGRVAYKLADGHEIGASVLEALSRSSYDRGGATVDAYNRDKTRVYGLYLRNRINHRWTSTLRWGHSEDNSTSFDPARSQFATRQTQWTWQNDVRLPVGNLLLAVENLDQAVDSTTGYTVRNRTVRSFVAGYQGNLGAHSWQAALRRDENSQFGGRTTGSLGYGYRFADGWQARVASGTAFKAPSFNQLYFPGFGNVNLKPEEARNLEAGLNWERGGQHASLTWFDNRITNLIAGFPVVNIGKARITGTSLSYGLTQGFWRADAGLDLMRPVDDTTGNRLQRRPAEMARLALTYAPAAWKAGGEITAIGRRYDTTTQGRAMGGYAVANLFAAWEVDKNWTLEGRINNVFDRVYENAWAYAVPDRQMFIGVRYAPK